MCGIAGLISKNKLSEESKRSFVKSSDLMNHRGPDYKGVWEKDNIILIHFRLSIIDLDKRSHQPFHSASDKSVCVYNGEIYNFKDLEKKHSIPTKTSSDTEIMLETFEKEGSTILKDWNGIFACCIYDQSENKLHFIRDRFGVKPLYIYENKEFLIFSSEAKVILDWLPSFAINDMGLSQYMWYGNTTGQQTMIKGLYKVAPGSHLIFDTLSLKKISEETFWTIQDDVTPLHISENEAVDLIKNTLETAVKRQLIADVPLGILLSGGIDSSAIVAFASKEFSGKLDTYTAFYDFNAEDKSELEKARLISKKYNTNHNEMLITSNDVKEIFSKLVFQYDEPFADAASIPMYQLSNACSDKKKVILQGDGGDELFGGYRVYNVLDSFQFWKQVSTMYPIIPNHRWKEKMKRINFILNQGKDADLMAYYATQDVPYKSPYKILSDDYNEKIINVDWKGDYKKAAEVFKNENRVQRMIYTDTVIQLPNTFLEKVDKATMMCSIESRVPFLDNDLANLAFSLPSNFKVNKGQKKYILKKALKDIVPEEILHGPKKGFEVPYKDWLKKDLYHFAKDSFATSNSGIINKEVCLDLLEKNKSGESDYGFLLWKSLILCHWLAIYASKIILIE